MKKKNNNDEKIYEKLDLSKRLGETPEGFSVGSFTNADGSTYYIDIRYAPIYKNRGMYFRLFNAESIEKATKCARLPMTLPDDNCYPKQIKCFDTRLDNWVLSDKEIRNLVNGLVNYQPTIPFPDQKYFKVLSYNPTHHYLLWWFMQEYHHHLAERHGINYYPDPEYFDIPNFYQMNPKNRPSKWYASWIDIDGVILGSIHRANICQYDLIFNTSKKLGDDDGSDSFTLSYRDKYGIKFIMTLANKVEPCLLIFDNESFILAKKCARLSMIHPRYVIATDSARFKECWKFNDEELATLIEVLNSKETSLVISSYKSLCYKNGKDIANTLTFWECSVYHYLKQANFEETLYKIPEDLKMPDYANMEDPLVL